MDSLIPLPLLPHHFVPQCLRASPLGYVISRDRYLKRDELGVIYQLCVAPGHQRGLIGASLVKAVFERSAYGCKLYCCWCAQDLEANYFWESLGFVPIAFRAGGRAKGRGTRGKGRAKEAAGSSSSLAPDPLPHAPSARVHIFWQRRIDRAEVGGRGWEVGSDAADHARPATHHPRVAPTPYWYPFQTNAGAIREDRLVFPIPPGTHWRDVEAVAVPTAADGEPKELSKPKCRQRKAKVVPPPAMKLALGAAGGLRFAPPAPPAPPAPTKAQRPRVEKAGVRVDPRLKAATRELRDRWMERVNDPLVLPAIAQGKYDVSRTPSAVEGSRSLEGATKSMPRLAAG